MVQGTIGLEPRHKVVPACEDAESQVSMRMWSKYSDPSGFKCECGSNVVKIQMTVWSKRSKDLVIKRSSDISLEYWAGLRSRTA